MNPEAQPVIRDATPEDCAAIRRFGEAYIPPHYAPLIGPQAAAEQVRQWWNEDQVSAAIDVVWRVRQL